MHRQLSDTFYSDLPANTIPLCNLLGNKDLFTEVPEDWHVIVADIKNSTNAVVNGLHETVNLIATGCIVIVLNIVFRKDLSVPFFFGGDGATFLVPKSMLPELMRALLLHKNNVLASYNLDLRIGTVSVREIYNHHDKLQVAKFSFSKSFSIPVILGNGLAYAEQLIKAEDYLVSGYDMQKEKLNLEGMQCRWDKIAPPDTHEEVVTLLITSTEVDQQAQVFRKIVMAIDKIYGKPQKRQPISVRKLQLKTTFARLGFELRGRLGESGIFNLFKTWLALLVGRLYLYTKSGQSYLNKLVEMSETLVIDGRINTVISGTVKQRAELTRQLDLLEAKGELVYGLHISNDSIMSCYVRNLKDDHVHFVDGSEGGYTKAAQMLKGKLN